MIHILRIKRLPSDRYHPTCSCGLWFDYAPNYGAARMAADSHTAAVAGTFERLRQLWMAT